MNKICILLLLILFACLLIACDSAAGPAETAAIQPGDQLGDMSIVISPYPSPHVYSLCEEEELLSGSCQVPSDIGHLWIANGWEEDTQEALEAAWADSSWQLMVDGRMVDLPAFGYTWWDEEEPTQHVWDITLRNPALGEHTVQWIYDIAGEQAEETWVFIVTDEIAWNE